MVIERLARAGCITAEEEAAELLRAAAGDTARLEDLVRRRCDGEPLAWLTGAVTFCGIDLCVSPGVYVPRWQTEPLARRAAALMPGGGIAVDLCTGSGAVAAVLGAVGTELDPRAAACARSNGVDVYEGFLDDPLPGELAGCVDVMTAVAPYVPTDAMHLLPRDVQAFEPRLALDGGVDGTELLAQIVRRSVRWLKPGGWLLLELGGDQADDIGALMTAVGFTPPDVMRDGDGDARAICAHLA
jgi:release factor glutamine methyltransferase